MNIDLNADVAEGCGQDDKLLTIVSSANVCCGLHAGSYAEMIATLQLAKKNNVRVGAHPGLDDRENFGRTNQSLGEEEYRALMAYQLGATKALCNLVGVSLDYVKPHGALYNQAAVDESLFSALSLSVQYKPLSHAIYPLQHVLDCGTPQVMPSECETSSKYSETLH